MHIFHIRAVHAYIPHKGSACIYFLMSHADTIFQLVDFDFYSVNSRSFSSSELWEDDYQPGQTTRIFSPHKTASTGIYPATQSSVTPSVGIQPSVRVNVLNVQTTVYQLFVPSQNPPITSFVIVCLGNVFQSKAFICWPGKNIPVLCIACL